MPSFAFEMFGSPHPTLPQLPIIPAVVYPGTEDNTQPTEPQGTQPWPRHKKKRWPTWGCHPLQQEVPVGRVDGGTSWALQVPFAPDSSACYVCQDVFLVQSHSLISLDTP